MGWGTFAAGQALRWARSKPSSTDSMDDFIAVSHWLAGFFHRSYMRRLLRGTALLHPTVWEAVDLDIWEEDINKVVLRNWRTLLVFQAIAIPIAAFSFWPLLFVNVPFFWYFPKRRMIHAHQSEINEELAINGWDVDQLLGELHDKLSERAAEEARQENEERERQERLRRRRKYGRD